MKKQIWIGGLLASMLMACSSVTQNENTDSISNSTESNSKTTVTITGQVTDYNGHPIDSCSVCWKTPSFANAVEVLTDKNGRYMAKVPKGKYQSVTAIHMPSYASIAMQEGKFKEKKISIVIYVLAPLFILKYIFL